MINFRWMSKWLEICAGLRSYVVVSTKVNVSESRRKQLPSSQVYLYSAAAEGSVR